MPTCYPNSGKLSRGDFILCNREALPYVSEFEVASHPDIPVHRYLQMSIELPGEIPTVLRRAPTDSITSLIDDALKIKHGQQDGQPIPKDVRDTAHGQLRSTFENLDG